MTENEAYDAGRAFERHRLRQELEQRLHTLTTQRSTITAYRIAELGRVLAILNADP